MNTKKSLRFDLGEISEIKDIIWHKSSGYVFIHSGDDLYFLYIEKENMKPQLIYEDIEKTDYSEGELFVLARKEIKTSKF
jgi:hypothetical protein